ncbi:MAG: class I SAM-dependent DNA methyltransferase [Thermoguttaceae bacterium]|nr:class I SAM-dependent DNA methyltransferase [Thermoguttaceae bacterium]
MSATDSAFERGLSPEDRHRFGVHFTSPAQTALILGPSLLDPWRRRITAARRIDELLALRDELASLKILDPACGAGSFLVDARGALLDLEAEIVRRARRLGKNLCDFRPDDFCPTPQTSLGQLFGIEIRPDALRRAREKLVEAQRRALDRWNAIFGLSLPPCSPSFPESNLILGDALFLDWPPFDLAVGNPPFLSKNKITAELGLEKFNQLRERYAEIPGRADYCVYWFYRTHRLMKPGARAGLIGTDTIRQNYSRQGGLEYITKNGGTIGFAAASEPWPGSAKVRVSVVNWIKGSWPGRKTLLVSDPERRITHPAVIPPSLSSQTDVTGALTLAVNRQKKYCFLGQTHGHEAFLLEAGEARRLLSRHPRWKKVLFPYLTGDDLLGRAADSPSRYVIDFSGLAQEEAKRYGALYRRLAEKVCPYRQAKALAEQARNAQANRGGRHHAHAFARWWRLFWEREELLETLRTIPRYIACSRVSKEPIFEFVDSAIHPNDSLQVFAFDDDYSFGILQSAAHCRWFLARCSTLGTGWRYTANTVFDTFPWPPGPTSAQAAAAAQAAANLRAARQALVDRHALSLRELYARKKDFTELADAHEALDDAVWAAYGARRGEDILAFLLELNRAIASGKKRGRAPGPVRR